jgi:mannan endo-1,4-beta-mannosidase
VVAIGIAFAVRGAAGPGVDPGPGPGNAVLPTTPGSYTGLVTASVPNSYAGVRAFTAATGVTPNVIPYYSGWLEPFQASFARTVARHGAVPLVQIDPTNVSVVGIGAGWYDGYLDSFATAIRAYRSPVIVSFGHEMNGDWYSWSNAHTTPRAFVAAWRHIVTLFRARGASNVTWLWAVNAISAQDSVPSPRPWWPGSSYVTWVGIDGYYLTSSSTFVSLFGPTIAVVRGLTHAPILISETAAAPTANQPAKIADLFAGVRLYGLLGFVWFDAKGTRDWRLSSPAAIAAFRRGSETYRGAGS